MSTLDINETVALALWTVFRLERAGPRIARVRYGIRLDSIQELTLYVWVILEKAPDVFGHQFRPFADATREDIRLSMRHFGVGLFQHVRFLLENEEGGFVPGDAVTLRLDSLTSSLDTVGLWRLPCDLMASTSPSLQRMLVALVEAMRHANGMMAALRSAQGICDDLRREMREREDQNGRPTGPESRTADAV